MKILRHILSHLLFILFLVAIVSVYYYRTLLLPNDVVEKVDGIVTEVYPPALKFVSKRDYFWSIGGERIVSFDDLTIFEKGAETVSAKKEEQPKSESIVISNVENKSDAKESIEVENKVESKEENIVKKEETTVFDNKKRVIEPKNENVTVEELPVAVKDSDTSSERDLLISARSAFNQGEMIESEKFYIELTQLDNDNPDIFGELGNVYYAQGKWEQAGQAYYEAAVRLITDRNYEQVHYLQQVINGLNTEYAEKLSQFMVKR